MNRPPAPPLLLAALFSSALLVPACSAMAATSAVQTDHLQSRLVAETTAAVPGTDLTLGLLLEHAPHWHTYWRNPGDSGLPTRLELALPEGVVAEPIAWPHPQRFELSDIVNFGYGERRLLPVTIRIPADYAATTLPVRATASWLICEKECIPGKAEYVLELPMATSTDVDGRWRADFTAARADLPRAAAATLAVAVDGPSIVFTFTGLDDGAMPAQWQWFPETPQVVANSAQPSWQRVPEGWRARWPRNEYFTALPAEVALVAVADDGAGAALRFASTSAAAAAPTPLDRSGMLAALAASVFALGLLGRHLVKRSKRPDRTKETHA